MNQLGIKFADNDFCLTVTSFLYLLLPTDFTHPQLAAVDFTKAQVVELFNNLAYGLYLMKQNGFQYDHGHIPAYLKIDEKDVYVDGEVAKYTADNNGWCNGEFFCVDFRRRYVWAV